MKKKTLALFLVLTVVLTSTAFAFTAFAANVGTFTVAGVTGNPGDTVKVDVSISNNPGIVATKLNFSYDNDALTLISTEDKGLLGTDTYVSGNDLTLVPYSVIWEDGLSTVNHSANGVIVSLTFKIAENASEGVYPIELSYDAGSTFDTNLNDVAFNTVNGAVTVNNSSVIEEYDASVSLSSVTGRPGENVNVFVTLGSETNVKSMSISDLVYDSTKLTLTKGEWLAAGSVIDDWNIAQETGVITYKENTKLSGNVFLLSFAIKEDIEDAEVAISCKYKITAQNSSNIESLLSVEVIPGSISILNILRGDVNGDGYVDSNDAIYVLYHTLLPERYEINQNGDFDGDGYVNSNDAIHLLYHTLLPERYPLA